MVLLWAVSRLKPTRRVDLNQRNVQQAKAQSKTRRSAICYRQRLKGRQNNALPVFHGHPDQTNLAHIEF
jgi:hypothetical protein